MALALVGRAAGRQARRELAHLLEGVEAADWHADAALVLSELVANALEECGECHLCCWYVDDPPTLRVEVTDGSRNLPVLRALNSNKVGGHGLRIVEALSTRWGVDSRSAPKIVWFEIRRMSLRRDVASVEVGPVSSRQTNHDEPRMACMRTASIGHDALVMSVRPDWVRSR